MKEAIDGIEVKDRDAQRRIVYFICAYYFHWSPEEIDRMDNEMLESLLYIMPLWKAKTKDVMERG